LKGEIALRLRQIIREISKGRKFEIISGNVRANHVHLLVSCPSDLAPSKIAQYLKGKSSYRLQREFRELQKRYWGQHLWARGYFCSTVGAVNEDMIKHYVENQSENEGEFKVWDLECLPQCKNETKRSLISRVFGAQISYDSVRPNAL
jgi:putative transposase